MEKKSRVAITGLGAITNLGQNVDELWNGLVSGKVGYARVNEGDTYPIGVINFDPKKWYKAFGLIRGDQCMPMALTACEEALGDANYVPHTREDQQQSGIAFATGSFGIDKFRSTLESVQTKGWKNASVKNAIFSNATNTLNAAIGMRFNMAGQINTPDLDGIAGVSALLDGYETIVDGNAIAMITGAVDDLTIDIFFKASALHGFMTKQDILRPMTKGSDGVISSLGGAALVLEEFDEAIQRKSKIYAELKGASQMIAGTQSSMIFDSKTVQRNIEQTLERSKLKHEEIDLVIVNGNGIEEADREEAQALEETFGTSTPITGFNGQLGYTRMATGAIDSVIAVKSIQNGQILPLVNQGEPINNKLNFVKEVTKSKIKNVLINSISRGGAYASAVISKVEL